jgi:hypothetical protein
MTPLNFSTVLLAPLAAVLMAHPAAAANSLPFGFSNHAHAPSGSDRADREPFSIRFAGFIPVDYLQFAPNQEDEPALRLPPAHGSSAMIGEAHGAPNQNGAQSGYGHASGPSSSGTSRGAGASAAGAEGHRRANDKSPEQSETESPQDQINDEGEGSDIPPAPSAAAYSTVTPIPEPTTALFGAAVLGVCGLTRRRPRNAPPAP